MIERLARRLMAGFVFAGAAAAVQAQAIRTALPSSLVVDYQLGGDYRPPEDVTTVVRDSTGRPAPGLYNICYVNGFQTQPGVRWPTALLVPGRGGKPLVDPGWPDEFILDISTQERRTRILKRLLPTLKTCANKGFDAVEFDNLDSYTRSRGHLTQQHAVAFAKMLVAAAHDLELATAQKNTPELGRRGRDVIGFDFAITEECYRWSECAAFTDVYGAQVIGIEYIDDLRGTFADACADPARPRGLTLRDRLLVPQGRRGYVFRHC